MSWRLPFLTILVVTALALLATRASVKDSSEPPPKPGPEPNAARAAPVGQVVSTSPGDEPAPPRVDPSARVAHPRAGPSAPSSAKEISTELFERSGPGKAEDYDAYLAALRRNREASAARLEEAFWELDEEAREGAFGRRLVFAMGEVGHEDSMESLETYVNQPLPTAEEGGEALRLDAVVTRSIALRGMRKIMLRYRTPQMVDRVHTTLERFLTGESRHLAVVAAQILVAHAPDPEAERARQAALLAPRRAELADVTARPRNPRPSKEP